MLCYLGCTAAADVVAGGPPEVGSAAALPAAGSYDQSGLKSDDAPPIKRYTASSLFKRFKRIAKRSEDISVNKASTADSDLYGAFASWEPCARAIETERKDFGEFVVSFPNLQLCNKPGLKPPSCSFAIWLSHAQLSSLSPSGVVEPLSIA